jgi:hypothetical protein
MFAGHKNANGGPHAALAFETPDLVGASKEPSPEEEANLIVKTVCGSNIAFLH